MRQETLLTGRGGRLHGRLWIGEHDSLGAVIVVHGLGDHGGRYESLASHLTRRRWAVFAFDLPGHGKSPGSRGRVDSFEGLLADIACAGRTVAERFQGLPQVILGQSMGGNLAINYSLRRDQVDPVSGDLAGLILCAPMLLPPKPPPRPHVFAAWLTGHLLPWVPIRRTVDPSLLTRDPDQAAALASDPLTHSQITMYLGTQLVAQGRWALDHARNVDVRTLVMYGGDDAMIDRGTCENVAIRIGELATDVCFPGMRHDLLHDVGSDEVLATAESWLQQFTPAGS